MHGRERFFALLDRTMPRVRECWDRSDGLRAEVLSELMKTGSSGEIRMGLFFRDVWQGGREDDPPFNLVEATRVLDEGQVQIIRDWIDEPFS